MRTKLFLIAVCTFCVTTLVAQSDYSNYLDESMKELGKGNCEGAQKLYNVYKELSGQSKPSVQVLIDDCKAEKKMSKKSNKTGVDLEDNSYCRDGKNRYVAWGIAGAGYPWNLVSGVEFRGGNLIGVGFYGELGMDFTACSYHYQKYEETATFFHYAGGIKFYPYRGLFLDAGYGTISKPVDKSEKSNVGHSHGVLFHAGYNLVTNLSGGYGFFLGVNGGASYDVINKVFAPSVNLKIGIAWKWEK